MVCEFSDREGHLPVSKCEGSSFVSVEGGKEVPKLRFGFFVIFQVIDVPALVMRSCPTWSHDAFVCEHRKNKMRLQADFPISVGVHPDQCLSVDAISACLFFF